MRSAVIFDLPVLAGGLPGHLRCFTHWAVEASVLRYRLALVPLLSGFTAMPLAPTQGRTAVGGHVRSGCVGHGDSRKRLAWRRHPGLEARASIWFWRMCLDG